MFWLTSAIFSRCLSVSFRVSEGNPRLSICGRPPRGKGKRWDCCSAWSDAVICPASLTRQEDSRRPVWEFADWFQITRSVLEALWKGLVVTASSLRLLRHTLLPLTPTPSRSWCPMPQRLELCRCRL